MEKIKSPLQAKEVFIKAIKREGSWLSDIHENHDGSFMFSGARWSVRGLPTDEKRKVYIDPLTAEERAWYESDESGMGLQKNDLSVLKVPCWWNKFEISIDRNGMNLNLMDTTDYLRYKFLLVQPQIAPSWGERFERAEYKFALVDSKTEQNEKLKLRDKKKRSERAFGKMEDSMDRMKAFLTIYNEKHRKGKLPEAPTQEFLIAEIERVLEENINGFLEIAEDEDLDIKSLIFKAVDRGAVIKEGKSQYKINGEEDVFLFTELVDFLKAVENQKVYGKIKVVVEG